ASSIPFFIHFISGLPKNPDQVKNTQKPRIWLTISCSHAPKIKKNRRQSRYHHHIFHAFPKQSNYKHEKNGRSIPIVSLCLFPHPLISCRIETTSSNIGRAGYLTRQPDKDHSPVPSQTEKCYKKTTQSEMNHPMHTFVHSYINRPVWVPPLLGPPATHFSYSQASTPWARPRTGRISAIA
ncbi:hypothetical protein M431DRAFT_539964, partial [Trichoderma harzianum CBS 226.95]